MYIKRLDKNVEFPDTHTWIMGIMNVTPDSFSDGGKYTTEDNIKKQTHLLISQDVDIIDIGGESTRPGHTPTTVQEELERIVPAIKAVREISEEVIISVDTWKAEVARAALEAGADMINDQWAATREPEIAEVCAEFNAPLILMHNREEYEPYDDIMEEMKVDLNHSIDSALEQGMDRSQLVIDPGVGFAKTADDNLETIQRLGELRDLGLPILLATSRKGFIGKLYPSAANQRDVGTSAITVAGILNGGADMVRVHNVKVNKEAATVADAIVRGTIALD